MTAFCLVRSCAEPDERYRTLDGLTARVAELRGPHPVELCRAWLGRVAQPTGECVSINAGGAFIGYAFVPRELLDVALRRDGSTPKRRLWHGRRNLEAGRAV
jgi:hypothetical protein